MRTSSPPPQRKPEPPPGHEHGEWTSLPPQEIRLANRITLLTFLAATLTVLGLVLVPRALVGGPALVRLVAALPLLAAAGTILHLRRLRADLRRARQAGEPRAEPPWEPSPGGARPPAPRSAGGPTLSEPRRSPAEGSHGLER